MSPLKMYDKPFCKECPSCGAVFPVHDRTVRFVCPCGCPLTTVSCDPDESCPHENVPYWDSAWRVWDQEQKVQKRRLEECNRQLVES